MGHKSGEKLRHDLLEARTQVRIGGQYRHYKGQAYTAVGFAVIEATDGIGVLYQADYTGLEGIVFLRPLEDFLSLVETDEGRVLRFALIS